MKIITETQNLIEKDSSIAIGKFDGVHMGHQKLIERISQDTNPVVFTFDSGIYSAGNSAIRSGINTREESYDIIEKMGVNAIVEYPVNKETMSMSASSFIEEILVKKLDVKRIVCGIDFHFGKDRQGDTDMLKEYGEKYGYQVDVIDYECDNNGVKISSSIIRDYIADGQIERANALLGREFTITSTVIHGNMIGRTIGVPTANMRPQEGKVMPKGGVYRTSVELDGVTYKAITNIGTKPTIASNNELLFETHILDYVGDLYGKELTVKFHEFVRGEKKFSSLDELKDEILKNIEDYRNMA